ncbi:hypothetical protein CHUAL_012794 [Chamberlinius hualienensis]
MGSQQFCLRWNNHQSNLLNVFEDLLERETLVDVTLACEGLSLKAHKVVLSACSPFFQNLFADNPCKHPIVILKGINYGDLKSVVDFMYRGEINVVHDQLDNLLKVADTLQVKGLAEVTENFCQTREQNAVSQPSLGNCVSNADNSNYGRNKQINRGSQPPPSPPLSKRKKKSHKTSAPSVNAGNSSASVEETNNHIQTAEENQFPVLVKTETTPNVFNSRLCSSDDNAEENEDIQSYGQVSNEMLVEAQCELTLGTNKIQPNERNVTHTNPSECLDVTYTNEHLSVEVDPNNSAVSRDVSNRPPSLIREDIDESIYYPSTSASFHNNFNPEDSDIPSNANRDKPEFDYGISNKGCTTLIYKGHAFCHHRDTRSGSVHWRCTKFRTSKCRSLLHTHGNIIVREPCKHSHS